MLRATLIAGSAAALITGAVLTGAGLRVPGLYLLGTGAAVFLGTVFERWRYRTAQHLDGEPWRLTGERFEDPTTGELLEVYFNPRTGQRRYLTPRSSAPGRAD